MARRTVRRRRPTLGSEPPAEALDESGRIPFLGERGAAFLTWLRAEHPEIEPVDDLITRAILDGVSEEPAAVVVARYCDPTSHR